MTGRVIGLILVVILGGILVACAPTEAPAEATLPAIEPSTLMARDLADQSESETDPPVGRPTHPGRSIKRLVDALPLLRRNSRAAIFDTEKGTAGTFRYHRRLDRRIPGVARGVLQKVPDESSQKTRIPLEAHRLA